MTTISIEISTPETDEHVINGLIEQLRDLTQKKNPGNEFDATSNISRPVVVPAPTIDESVGNTEDSS